jgi:hypothetical protein
MHRPIVNLFALAVVAVGVAAAGAASFSSWSPAINLRDVPGTSAEFNTPASEGCPSPSRDGLRLYIASNRPGGYGDLDIWMAERESTDDPFGPPVNLGPSVNSAAKEFCPTPMRDGHGFLFVSNRPDPDGCGGDDIYRTRFHHENGWEQPQNVGCVVNSAANEASPFLVEDETGVVSLYFSSNRPGGYDPAPPLDMDLYVSAVEPDGTFDLPVLVPGVNSAFDDARPNVRRDGLEIVFDSTRPFGSGSSDIWSALRASPADPWSEPQNLGPNVNSIAAETRPSLSWDRMTLYFGSTRVGSVPAPSGAPSQDVYLSTRERVPGPSQ